MIEYTPMLVPVSASEMANQERQRLELASQERQRLEPGRIKCADAPLQSLKLLAHPDGVS